MFKQVREEYEQELEAWLDNRCLLTYPEKELRPSKCLIILIAVVQKNMGKVHPMLDYCELAKYIDTYIDDMNVCVHRS